MVQDQTEEKADDDLDNPARRDLLFGLLTLYSLSLIPWGVVQAAPTDARSAFRLVSEFITGRRSLRGGQEGDIFNKLTLDDPGFPAKIVALQALIEERRLHIDQLQAVLDTEFPTLAPLPRQIASGWFLGVVGSGFGAITVAYEHALNAEIVEEVLKPQGFCLGNPGVWAQPPLSLR